MNKFGWLGTPQLPKWWYRFWWIIGFAILNHPSLEIDFLYPLAYCSCTNVTSTMRWFRSWAWLLVYDWWFFLALVSGLVSGSTNYLAIYRTIYLYGWYTIESYIIYAHIYIPKTGTVPPYQPLYLATVHSFPYTCFTASGSSPASESTFHKKSAAAK